MLVDVNGINVAFRDQLIELVESIENPKFKLSSTPGRLGPASLVFEVDDSNDIDDVVPLLKGTIKKSELGAIMMFNVAPHGQAMWVPKKK